MAGALPSTENGTVVDLFAKRPPRRRKNTDARPREHLTEAEVALLREAAKKRGRYGNRDALMILMAYRHGLRVGDSSICSGRRLQREQPAGTRSVFVSERGAPMTPRGFAQMLSRTATSITFSIAVHPHMLRHACGFKLANDGRDTRVIQDYLGHQQIQHTVRYTEMASGRFDGFFKD
ncbi:MAG: tyrosine-type recombinase/integrase [Bradyrhizobium sp.]